MYVYMYKDIDKELGEQGPIQRYISRFGNAVTGQHLVLCILLEWKNISLLTESCYNIFLRRYTNSKFMYLCVFVCICMMYM